MKEIQLTQGKITQVDDEDYVYLSQFNWYYKDGYATRTGVSKLNKKTTIRMQTDIMCPDEGFLADHKDRKTLNNQRYNLRICTQTQNNQNAPRTLGQSGYRGVCSCYHKQGDKVPRWRVRIRVDTKLIYLGYFDNIIVAAQVYDAAAKKYHGEFAVFNFPGGV